MTKLRLKAFVFPLFKILYSRYEHDRTKLTTVAVLWPFLWSAGSQGGRAACIRPLDFLARRGELCGSRTAAIGIEF